MPVVVKIADQRHGHAKIFDTSSDFWNCGGRVLVIDSDANQLRSSPGKGRNLPRGAFRVRGVGIGHRLHDYRVRGSNRYAANESGNCFSARRESHWYLRGDDKANCGSGPSQMIAQYSALL